MLRIGCVKYLNAQPLIHGWEGNVMFDHPSALCRQLVNGQLDIALVSSFEFLRNPIYRIVDDVSISSDGPVYSVILAYHGGILEIEEIELDPASETSVNLLRCLTAELGFKPRLVQKSTGPRRRLRQSAMRRRARLLIGDQAIRFRQRYGDQFCFWDLGEEWRKRVGLPFVYALWLVRPEIADPQAIANRLRVLRDQNLADLNRVIEATVVLSSNPPKAKADYSGQRKRVGYEFLSRYYREHLRFRFGEKEKEGLRIFAKLCQKHGLLQKRNLTLRVV